MTSPGSLTEICALSFNLLFFSALQSVDQHVVADEHDGTADEPGGHFRIGDCAEADAGPYTDDFDSSSITTIDRSIESHLMAFAAEESRRNGGKVMDLK